MSCPGHWELLGGGTASGNLLCQKCSRILESPVTIHPCRHTICTRCQGSSACSVCSGPVSTSTKSTHLMKLIDDFVAKSTMRCTTCGWQGRGDLFKSHQRPPPTSPVPAGMISSSQFPFLVQSGFSYCYAPNMPQQQFSYYSAEGQQPLRATVPLQQHYDSSRQPYNVVYVSPSHLSAASIASPSPPLQPSVAVGGNGGASVPLQRAAYKVIAAPAPDPPQGPDPSPRIEAIMKKVAHLTWHLPASETRKVVSDAVQRHADDSQALQAVVESLLRNPSRRAEEVAPNRPLSAPSTSTKPTASKAMELQIFWDLDNLPIPPNMGARVMYSEIIDFFVRKGIIDGRTTAYTHVYFVDDDHGRRGLWATPQNKEALRSLGCVLVLCTTRKEDADRQMTNGISQLIAFDASNPVLIISSDKDFMPSVQRLRKHGNDVYVIHDAYPGSEHEKLLKFSATQCWHMRDVVRGWSNDFRDDRHNGGARIPKPAHFTGSDQSYGSTSRQPLEQNNPIVVRRGEFQIGHSVAVHGAASSSTVKPVKEDNPIQKLMRRLDPTAAGSPTPSMEVSNPIAKLMMRWGPESFDNVETTPPEASDSARLEPANPLQMTRHEKDMGLSRGPAQHSLLVDGAPAVSVDGTLIFTRYLDFTDGLDRLLDTVGKPESVGKFCLDQYKCKKGARCCDIHFKFVLLENSRLIPSWVLSHDEAYKKAILQQRGLIEPDENRSTHYCTDHEGDRDENRQSLATCAGGLHDKYVVIDRQQLPAFMMVYNNAAFNALRGLEVSWCNGAHPPGTTDATCDKAHARQCSLLNKKVNCRFFSPNAALRNSVLFNIPMSLCSGHLRLAPKIEHYRCTMAHPRYLVIGNHEVKPWEFIEDEHLFSLLDGPKEQQRSAVICPGNHPPGSSCRALHRSVL